MKKALLIVSCLAILFLNGCSANNTTNSDYDNIKYQIVDLHSGVLTDEIHFRNILNSTPVSIVNPNAPNELSIEFIDKTYDLEYINSLYYSVNGRFISQYHIKGHASSCTVGLDESGSLHSIVCDDLAVIPISQNASTTDILQALKDRLAGAIHFSHYSQESIHSPDTDKGQRYYAFTFYNEFCGVKTDWLSILVRPNGSVYHILYSSFPSDSVSIPNVTINQTRESAILANKSADLAGTDMKYLSHSTPFAPQMVFYNNVLYVRYRLNISFENTAASNQPNYTHAADFLVPLSLLT